MQRGFQLDLNLCTGCSACAVACAIENELPWGSSWRWVETFNEQHLPGLPLHHLSLACNHCADAPCMHHCPALAYSKDAGTGAVLLNPDSCIGCKYCTWACPYDAPRYDPAEGIVSKCTFCHHRQVEGLAPACVSQCPTSALQFGEVESLAGTSEVPGFPQTEAKPSIRFVEARGAAPEQTSPVPDLVQLAQSLSRRGPNKTSLKSEWPLLVFSLLCALLTGAMATRTGRTLLGPTDFVVFSALAALASSFHLGKKSRAWRAVLNWKRSWVSREILAFGLFVMLSALHFGGPGSWSWVGPLAGLAGFAMLFAIDRVYRVTRTPGLGLHSAQTLLTGVMLAGLLGANPAVGMAAMLLKLGLYLRRKTRLFGAPNSKALVISATRVVAGLILPLALLTLEPSRQLGAVWWLIGLGELIDRGEFYLELKIPTPGGQIQQDLERAAVLGRAA